MYFEYILIIKSCVANINVYFEYILIIKSCVANSSPATHQTVRQQGGTGEDGHIHLANWTLRVAAIEKIIKNLLL